MRKHSKYISALMWMSLALTACSNEEPASSAGSGVDGEAVLVTLTVDRANGNTRTTIDETDTASGVGLTNVWAKGDKVTLVSGSGPVGELTLEGEGGSSEGVFSGELAIEEGKYTVWYLGAESPYASIADKAAEPSNTLAIAGCSVSGNFSDLNKGDLMNAEVDIVVGGGKAYAAKNVCLTAQMAMAHFTLSGDGIPSALSADDAALTLSYTIGDKEYSYNITNKAADVYVPLFPGTFAPSFTLVSDGKTYSCVFASDTDVRAGVYYIGTGKGDGNGVSVGLVDVTSEPEQPGDDGTVGPVIEIDGRKYKFVRGNLYCDILNKDNYTWHLYDKETYYQLKAGTNSLYSTKTYTSYVRQINGTWKGSSNPTNVNENNHYIDLFPWGATGLGTGSYKAKLPDIIRTGVAGETRYPGTNWPSNETATMDAKANASIINLWQGYSFEDPVYDFGYAYMQTARANGDNRKYVTAPLEAYAYICDQSRSFSQGCVVADAGYDGGDAKGALILFGITDIEDAKAAITAVGGSIDTGFAALKPNKPSSGFNYLIKLPSYDSLQALSNLTEVNGRSVKIYAMFFASGGNAVYNFSKGTVDLNPTDGAYWTSKGAKGSSTTANAYGFYFRKGSTASEFCWETGASGVSQGRQYQRSVRLMVDVTDSDGGTVGPEITQ